MSYRNIYYDRKTNIITQWGWNSKGERDETTHFFSPYIYLPTLGKQDKNYVGIDNVPLTKKEFKSEWDKNKFVENYKGQVYFNLPPTQQFLLENYYEKDIQDLTQHPLKMFFIDIEVIANEFPDPKEAKFPITSVTIYDSITKKYYVWGVNRYDTYSCKDDLKGIEPEEIVYEFCENESVLLKKMLRFWRSDFPDLLIGYNSYSFDFPYIVNRIEQVMGEGKSAKLSPVDNIYGVEKENRFGHKYTEYTVGGVSHLDYMVLYKYFTPGERESDSLDFVCEAELGEGKLDYGGMSLQELSRKHWDRFINYNIWDVKLMVMLDAKRKYLDIARFSAVSGLCNLDKALGKVSIITGVLAKQAMQEGKIIPSNKGEKASTKIPGGYVKATPPGLYKDIISFDAKSLYPNTIITLNISPETKVAKIMSRNETNSIIYIFKTKKYMEMPTKEIKHFIREKNWSISGAGVFFDQTEKGICPKFIDNLYQQRVAIQKRLSILEKEKILLDDDSDEYKSKSDYINKLDTEQYLIKILLNSTYGALASSYFDLYDLDCAKSITMTGQAMIREAEKITNEFLQTNWDLPVKDRCTAIDTDSVAGDSVVRTSIGSMPIEELFEFVAHTTQVITHNGQEIVVPKSAIDTFCVNPISKELVFKPISYIYRHKVTKKRYKITSKSGKSVFVTADHSCMVERGGQIIETTAENILLTDKLLLIQPTCINK
jgi:DNA polymerase elongation subunit (family B)